MASPNTNADYYSGGNSLSKHDVSYFQNDGGFPGFNSGFASGQDQPVGQQWGYQPEHLGLAAGTDPSLYRSWPVASHGQNAHSTSALRDSHQNDFYGGHYAGESSQLDGIGVGATDGVNVQSQVQYDPNIVQSSAHSNHNYGMQGVSFANPGVQAGTIAPVALQTNSAINSSSLPAGHSKPTSVSGLQSAVVPFKVPRGSASGNFTILSLDALREATNSRQLHNFLNIGDDAQDLSITKTTIPAYNPRKSRNEIKKLVATDSKLAGKVAKKPSKKAKSGSAKAIGAGADRSKPLTRTSHSPSEDESSEDESSVESSDAEDTSPQAPLPPVRPLAPLEAVKYDTVKSLWRDPSRSLSNDDIRQGLADFWELMRTIRDRWKSDSEAVKKAEEAKRVNEVPLLQERVANQRDMLESSLNAALENGHSEILEHLGLNLQFILAVGQFLQDRARNTDYSGPLPKALLEVLSKVNTLTEANLEKTGLGKILPRFAKRGDEQIIKLSKKVFENASNASKKKKDGAKAAAAPSTGAKDAKSPATAALQKPGSPTAGTKRTLPGDGGADQPSKRVAANGQKPSAGQNVPTKSDPAVKRAFTGIETKSTTPAGTTAVAARQKAHQVVAKPSGFFSALQSAKKPAPPATSSAAANTASTSERATPATAPKPAAFSFTQMMANLEKPKEAEPVSKPAEPTSNESPEEKAKRVRKEERRKLRVSFKPESQLIEIRYFTHDPDEELGHDENQVRDVGDVESEGRMFKLKHQEDVMDIDDDDDDEADKSTDEIFTRPYPTLGIIDFSTLPDGDRNQNYESRGGHLKPDCPERWLQERREANTLLVVYTQAADIPTSPKEPPSDSSETPATPKSFGHPDERIAARIEEVKAAERAAGTPNMPISASNISSILSAMKSVSAQIPQIQQHQPQPAQQAPAKEAPKSELEQIFAKFAAPTQQIQQPQTAPTPNMAGFFAVSNPPNSFNASQPFQQQANPNIGDLSALLSSLQSGQMPPIPAMPGMPNTQGVNFPQLGQLPDFTQQNQSQSRHSQHPSGFPFENEERRRLREGEEADDQNQTDGGPGKFNKSKRPWIKGQKDARGLPFKVVQCKYWTKGKCTKGENCTFLHE